MLGVGIDETPPAVRRETVVVSDVNMGQHPPLGDDVVEGRHFRIAPNVHEHPEARLVFGLVTQLAV